MISSTSLIKANNPFLLSCKPSFLRGSPSLQTLPNNLCFIKTPTRRSVSLSCSIYPSYSTKESHHHQATSPFNFDGRSTIELSPKKNPFQVVYRHNAILQILKALKSSAVSFLLLGLLSMMLMYGRSPALAASGCSMGAYSFSGSSSPSSYSSESYSSSPSSFVNSGVIFIFANFVFVFVSMGGIR